LVSGLADAKASVDLILGDNGAGSRIRTGTIANGQDIDILVVVVGPELSRVLGWFDPEVRWYRTRPFPDDDPG
jgi:hypothetical protein